MENDNSDYEPPEQDSVLMEDKVDAKEEDYIVEDTQVVKKKVLKNQKSKEMAAIDKIVVPISSTDVSDVRKTVQQYIETDSNGKLKCTICGKEALGNLHPTTARHSLEKHIETHLDGLSFPCQLCGKTFRSRNALNIHRTRNHK